MLGISSKFLYREGKFDRIPTQKTTKVQEKRLPGEKENSNFSLNDRSDISKASRRENETKKSSRIGMNAKKRATTFVQPGENFFGVKEIKNRQLARKKSTSNFLPNYGIMEKNSEKKKTSSKNETSSDDISEEDEYVDEIQDIPIRTREDISRKDSQDSYRRNMLRRNVSFLSDYISYRKRIVIAGSVS